MFNSATIQSLIKQIETVIKPRQIPFFMYPILEQKWKHIIKSVICKIRNLYSNNLIYFKVTLLIDLKLHL